MLPPVETGIEKAERLRTWAVGSNFFCYVVHSDFKNHLDATPDGDGEGDEDKEVRGEGDDGGHAAVLLKGS